MDHGVERTYRALFVEPHEPLPPLSSTLKLWPRFDNSGPQPPTVRAPFSCFSLFVRRSLTFSGWAEVAGRLFKFGSLGPGLVAQGLMVWGLRAFLAGGGSIARGTGMETVPRFFSQKVTARVADLRIK